MKSYKEEFIHFMVDSKVLKFGDFVTKSGRNTPFFINTGFYRTGGQLKKLGEFYAKAIEESFGFDFEILFGPAYKGIPLSVAATEAIYEMSGKEIGYCSNRKRGKGSRRGRFSPWCSYSRQRQGSDNRGCDYCRDIDP